MHTAQKAENTLSLCVMLNVVRKLTLDSDSDAALICQNYGTID